MRVFLLLSPESFSGAIVLDTFYKGYELDILYLA